MGIYETGRSREEESEEKTFSASVAQVLVGRGGSWWGYCYFFRFIFSTANFGIACMIWWLSPP